MITILTKSGGKQVLRTTDKFFKDHKGMKLSPREIHKKAEELAYDIAKTDLESVTVQIQND